LLFGIHSLVIAAFRSYLNALFQRYPEAAIDLPLAHAAQEMHHEGIPMPCQESKKAGNGLSEGFRGIFNPVYS